MTAAENPLVWTCAVLLLVVVLQSARLGWRTRQRDVYLRLLRSLALERASETKKPRSQEPKKHE